MRCRRLAAILIGLLGLQGAQAGAATGNPCLRNIGNAPLEVGYLHDGRLAGGCQAHGWFRPEPGGGTPAPSNTSHQPNAPTTSGRWI